ncbi:transposase InsO family protein [Streptomyces sp. TE5632]
MLQRPIESAQFTSWAFTERARASGLVPSMGTIGDCYDCQSLRTGSRKDRVVPAATV